jgi:hypothetical protein
MVSYFLSEAKIKKLTHWLMPRHELEIDSGRETAQQ